MQAQELTPDGIDKFLDGHPAILQVIAFREVGKEDENQKFILAELSDGYASISKCFFSASFHFPDGNPLHKIIKVRLAEADIDKKQKLLQKKNKKGQILSIGRSEDMFEVIYNHVKYKIGNPIDFRQYVTNNMSNPQGNRKIPFPKQTLPKQSLSKTEQENSDDQLNTAIEQLKQKNKAQKVNGLNQNSKSNNYSKSSSVINSRIPRNKSSNPIEKIPEENRKSIKPEISHFSEEYTKIKELFLGIENFTLCVRILFVLPVKQFTNKKGVKSEMMSIEFGDASGTIMCTIFGDSVNKFGNLGVDEIYVIEGAIVSQNSFKGMKELRLTMYEKSTTIKRLKQNQVTIPQISDFAISVKQLTECAIGTSNRIKCYLKQTPKQQFVSKKGNNTVKKVLRLFDLDHHIEAEITLFGDQAQTQYLQGMYVLRGVEVQEFQGQRQYKAAFSSFVGRRLTMPNNKKWKHINVDEMNFTNVSSNQKVKKATVSSFLELQEKCNQIVDKQTIWSEIICYLKGIRHGGNTKTIYISCPSCRKKVQDNDTQCGHCGKSFPHPQPRYILSINLIDDHSSIWANSYDDTGSLILAEPDQQTFEADRFVMLNQQAVRHKINTLRYKRMKLKIVSQYQEYNGERRLKHKVLKVLPFSPQQQCKMMLEKLNKMLTSM